MTDENTAGDPVVGFVDYRSMIGRLHEKYPDADPSRIDQIAHEEYEAVTGGELFVVPAVVEEGTAERLEVEAPADDDVRIQGA